MNDEEIKDILTKHYSKVNLAHRVTQKEISAFRVCLNYMEKLRK